jgi:hypothetical protein
VKDGGRYRVVSDPSWIRLALPKGIPAPSWRLDR